MRTLISRITSRFRPAKPAQEPPRVRVYPEFQVNRVRAVCKHCRKPIFLQGPNSEWRHQDELSFFACYPDAIVSPEAEPDPDAAPPMPAPRVPSTRCRHCKEPIRETGGEWRHYRAMIPDVRDCDWVDPLRSWTVAEPVADDTVGGDQL